MGNEFKLSSFCWLRNVTVWKGFAINELLRILDRFHSGCFLFRLQTSLVVISSEACNKHNALSCHDIFTSNLKVSILIYSLSIIMIINNIFEVCFEFNFALVSFDWNRKLQHIRVWENVRFWLSAIKESQFINLHFATSSTQ